MTNLGEIFKKDYGCFSNDDGDHDNDTCHNDAPPFLLPDLFTPIYGALVCS
jgi:hypothetical protein